MKSLEEWPEAATIGTARLLLEPLRVEHAVEMAPLLDDPALHAFTGGEPASAAGLRERYERQVVGVSPGGDQRWLNWVLRRGEDGRLVGTVQATVMLSGERPWAEVAWVVGSAYQRRGYAVEAARALVGWLRQEGVSQVVAHVHPAHEASAAVARAVGLAPTATVHDGEVRWEG